MINFSSAQRYFLYSGFTDMRKSFDGLSGIIIDKMKQNIYSRDVFIFINKRSNRIKFMVWDRSGFVIYYKRLEKGTFELPSSEKKVTGIELQWDELVLILEGIKLSSVKRRMRYDNPGLSTYSRAI